MQTKACIILGAFSIMYVTLVNHEGISLNCHEITKTQTRIFFCPGFQVCYRFYNWPSTPIKLQDLSTDSCLDWK